MLSKGTEKEDIISRYRNENLNYNILPSYHMDKGIVGKKLNPGDEVYQFHHEPPAYSSSLSIDPTMSVQSVNSYSENTITVLDNLDSLASLENMVRQEIYFTKDNEEEMTDPEIINNEMIEYKQGDKICGYIIIENRTAREIPLNVYYVLFQGIYKKDDKYDKFIQMVDFKASLNYDDTESLIDVKDGTYLTMGSTLLPHIKYKRFFMFRVPLNLLDCACGNQLGKHLQTLPSCGETLNDFMPATIRYSIRSTLVCHKNNEFYRLADISKPVRIIPRANNPVSKDHNELQSMCKALVNGIDLELSSRGTKYSKAKSKIDAYVEMLEYSNNDNEFSTVLKNQKLKAKVPNREYKFKYYPPALCHIPQSLNIPIELAYDSNMEYFSIVKGVSCELVVVSISSTEYSIPHEIDYNLLFSKQNNLKFDDLVIRPSLLLLKEIQKLKKHIPNFVPEPQSISELKCLSYLASSYVYLSADTNATMEVGPIQKDHHSTKIMNLHLNLNSMFLKDLDKAIKSNRLGSFCLLPSFQSCKLIRMYYLQLTIHIHSEDLVIHVPITIE